MSLFEDFYMETVLRSLSLGHIEVNKSIQEIIKKSSIFPTNPNTGIEQKIEAAKYFKTLEGESISLVLIAINQVLIKNPK